MANPQAGEVAIRLDGARRVMKLTLGALAELEDGLGEAGIVALVERFETGRVTSGDVLGVIVAGLRGGGWDGDRRTLLTAEIEGGIPAAARAAAQLLVRAFAMPGG